MEPRAGLDWFGKNIYIKLQSPNSSSHVVSGMSNVILYRRARLLVLKRFNDFN